LDLATKRLRRRIGKFQATMTRFRLAVSFLACATIACSDTTVARHGALTVTVDSPNVLATRTAPASVVWGRFSVEVTLRNPSAYTVAVFSCGATAERETPNGWVTALEPVCALSNGVIIELPPSGERTVTEHINGALSGNAAPEFASGVLAGRYRFLYRYAALGDAGAMDEARSAPFDVIE
jgi:hypothetical protein